MVFAWTIAILAFCAGLEYFFATQPVGGDIRCLYWLLVSAITIVVTKIK